jgi:vacuolar-type H+-ATPase subunit E/Vma4
MELTLTNMEMHALKAALETAIAELSAQIAGARGQSAREELEIRRELLRSILEKLPESARGAA